MGAVILHFLDVPTATDRENEPAARKLIEAPHRLRGDNRVALRHQRNASAELERARRRRGKRQRDERVVSMGIALWQLAAAPLRRAPARRDGGMLPNEPGLETR